MLLNSLICKYKKETMKRKSNIEDLVKLKKEVDKLINDYISEFILPETYKQLVQDNVAFNEIQREQIQHLNRIVLTQIFGAYELNTYKINHHISDNDADALIDEGIALSLEVYKQIQVDKLLNPNTSQPKIYSFPNNKNTDIVH